MAERDDAIQTLLKRLAAEYAGDPNIRTIGFGLRNRGGTLETERVIIFYVHRKYGTARQIEAAGSKLIPPEIGGFATDVQPFDPRRAAAGERDDKEFDPLLGGVMTSNAEGHIYWFNGAGTLGCLVRDAGDATPMALSNWHVWGDGGDEGDDIIQPGHPTAGDHVEGVVKVAACGPLITSLIEWEAPDALTVGLYGGAAAAAVAAAASDVRDPTRRGQDHTPTDPGELTTSERVVVGIEYPQLPLPGVAFETKVTWEYTRHTTQGIRPHQVDETRINTQFLLGKLVVTDKPAYQPGEVVTVTAAIWDYQPRPCDGYHVVAHLIPHARPATALRVLLHPTVCPRRFPPDPPDRPDGGVVCLDFDDFKPTTYPPQGSFAWLHYLSTGGDPVRVVNWFPPELALQVPPRPLLLTHVPARRVIARVAQFTGTPVAMLAFNAAGHIVDQQTAPSQQGTIHELTLSGQGIVRVIVRGGGGEGLLISYCIEAEREGEITTGIPPRVATLVRSELPELELAANQLRARRRCFRGQIQLPPDEPAGKWDVHLTVQNINHVPGGTRPDIAATTIGGHLLSSHTSAEVLGCVAVMLLDHAFDVF
jgi:hypothetical protein